MCDSRHCAPPNDPASAAASRRRAVRCNRRDPAVLAAAGSRLPTIVDSYPAISPNFIHHTQVVRGGQFEYALKQGLSQMVVTAPAGTGELHVVKVKDLGTQANAITLTSWASATTT